MEKELELRSEKVRKIIGQVPSVFLRYGISTLFITLLVLIIIASFIPHTQTVDTSIIIKKNESGEIQFSVIIPQHIISQKEQFEEVNIDPESGWPFDNVFYIKSFSDILYISSSTNDYWYEGFVIPRENFTNKIHIESDVILPSKIIMKKQTILKWIIEKMFRF